MSWQVLALWAVLGQAPETSPEVVLPPKFAEILGKACVGFKNGQPIIVVKELGPLLAQAGDEHVAALEAQLAEQKLPPLKELLAQARMAMAQQDLGEALPKLGIHEAELVLPELHGQIEEVLALENSHPVMSDPLPLPATMEEHRQLFWQIHVLGNRIERARRIASHMQQFARSVPRARYDEVQGDARRLLEEDYAGGAQKSLQQFTRDLQQREMELRLGRLRTVAAVLSTETIGTEHLLAASVWDVDRQRVGDFLKSHRPRDIHRPALKAPNLVRQVDADARRAEKLAGDLTAKSKLLFESLHWWVRGRYGAGPETWGLVKSEAALASIEGQFALYMPEEPPRPTDPAALWQAWPSSEAPSATPRYDRRHHYWWAWESRSVETIKLPFSAMVEFW